MSGWFTRLLLSAAGSAVDGSTWLSGIASAKVINSAVESTRNRPHPWSTLSDYTSWQSLTDRTYLARHLPQADLAVLPPVDQVQGLFRRAAGGQKLSRKSTCLFPAFAQYLTDGFIRTTQADPRRTTTNHEIDLCPLYGLNLKQTNALRLKSPDAGRRGRLKSHFVGAEEYPPLLYGAGGALSDSAFNDLDPPLFGHSAEPHPPLPATHTSWLAVGGDRVNSTPFTAMMNTLLLREHNRIAHELETRNPTWDDERVFQTARNIVIPLFIKIVVEEYINHITPLPFRIKADPSVAWTAGWNRPNWITAEFSLLYRWHSLMPDRIDWPGGAIPIGDFTLDNRPLFAVGLDAAFAAASRQPAGEIGPFNTAAALLPIEAFAVRQARANRLDTYNSYRRAFGIDPATSFAEISSDPDVATLLAQLYGSPDDVEF